MMMLLKILLKILAEAMIVPVVLFMFMLKLLVNLSSYVLGPFMLFLIGCSIYTIFQSAWNQLLILVILLLGCVLALFCTSWVIVALEGVNDRLRSFAGICPSMKYYQNRQNS